MSVLPNHSEHVALLIDQRPFEVVALSGEERLSTLFKYEITCACDSEVSAASLLAQPVAITLRDGFGAERIVTGLVAEAATSLANDGSQQLRLVVRPRPFRLTLGRDSKVFHDMSVVDVLRAELATAQLQSRFELSRSYAARSYIAQYREDTWSFLCRLLEQEGIYFWFDHSDDSQLVFSDDSTVAPGLVGGEHLGFVREAGMLAAAENVYQLGRQACVVPSKFSVRSFDPKRPALKISSECGDGPREIYRAVGGNPRHPDGARARAEILQRAARVAATRLAGVGWSVRLEPGRLVALEGHPLESLNGRQLITGIRLEIRQRRRAEGTREDGLSPLECHFEAISWDTPFVAEAKAPRAQPTGMQTATVCGAPEQEIHSDAHGRIRVEHHWDRARQRDDHAGKWMRVAQRCNGDSLLVPRVGWTVLCSNEEGSVDVPYVMRRIHDGEHLPTYPLPDNKTRVVFRTATSPGGGAANEIHFEDQRGSEEVFVNASRDMNLLVQSQRNELVGRDQARDIGVDHHLTVVDRFTDNAVGDQRVSIGGDESLAISGARNESVGGDEQHTVGATRQLKTKTGATVTAKKIRAVKVGAALIDTTVGDITAVSSKLHSVLVGGAAVKLGAESITETSGRRAMQTVGVAKLEKAKAGRKIDVRADYEESTTNLIMKTAARYVDQAEESGSWSSDGKLSAEGADILVEAKDRIELRCGNSTLVINSDGIELSGDNLDLVDADKLVFETKTIEHN